MKKNLILLSLLLLTVCLVLTGCGSDKKATITVYNWGDYIDKSVLEDFEEET